MLDSVNRKYDQAIIITRNNPHLVTRTCEIVDALVQRRIKIALIAYTGSSQAWVEGKDVVPQLQPFRRWVDDYFDTIFVPWAEAHTRELYKDAESYKAYLESDGYRTLNQLAERHNLPSAVRVGLGDKGRAEYHQAVTSAIGLNEIDYARTLGISVDTRLLIRKDTLGLVPHHGFHPGRMKPYRPDFLKALGSDAPLKMVTNDEWELQGAIHLLHADMDRGGVIDQYTLRVNPKKETAFTIYDMMYLGLTQAYINRLDKILDPYNQLLVLPQEKAGEHAELTERHLQTYLDVWSSRQWQPRNSRWPHGGLVQTKEFLSALLCFLPPEVSVFEIPDKGIELSRDDLHNFVSHQGYDTGARRPLIRDPFARCDGWGLA